MGDPKPLASLSSSLLARKGHARPAMRPQVFAPSAERTGADQDDLGWNDMGAEPMVSAAIPAIVRQQAALAERFEPTAAERPVLPLPTIAIARVKQAAKGRTTKAAFTLRLDPDRHLRLRLACAIGRMSAQAIVTEALDHYLGGQPEIDALARKAGS